MGGSDSLPAVFSNSQNHFNPRSPWGERRLASDNNFVIAWISIHAPRGGSDNKIIPTNKSATNFNPRSPWGERLILFNLFTRKYKFQSTLPVGGATARYLLHDGCDNISIHAPRGGSDSNNVVTKSNKVLFQSTLPVGGATRLTNRYSTERIISIHAPRGGSDNQFRQMD